MGMFVYVHAKLIRASIVVLNRLWSKPPGTPIPEISTGDAIAISIGGLIARLFLFAFAWSVARGSMSDDHAKHELLGTDTSHKVAGVLSILTDMVVIRIGLRTSLGKALQIAFLAVLAMVTIAVVALVMIGNAFPTLVA
ncbi:MAG: hypothetical protein H7210_06880 [Pyrinomonadaceae bacterium]|nr:hypothetical protein [Phycisphaerales bacterium]